MRKHEITEYISEQKGMLKLSVHVDMAMGCRALSWELFWKVKGCIFEALNFQRERERDVSIAFLYMLEKPKQYFLPGVEAAQGSCGCSKESLGPLSGLCWEVQNQLLKLLFSSTSCKILPYSEFTLLSAGNVFILPNIVLSQIQDECWEILVESKWENKSLKFSLVNLNR